MTVTVGWKGTKAIEAIAAISLDTSVTFGFNAQTSTSGSSACLYADAGLWLYGGLSGSLSVIFPLLLCQNLDGILS